jgi:hypothetical protein
MPVPVLLIHSDLGRVEWRQSLPVCERLAARLGVELVVVRRQAGDMMDRWLSRWEANVARYANLECVKLILPWSTPSTRFCTAELKSAVIASAMRRRFPTGDVVSAVGIRREESSVQGPDAGLAPGRAHGAQVRHGPHLESDPGLVARGRDRLRAKPRRPAARGLHDLRLRGLDQGVVRVLHHGLGARPACAASAGCADNVAIYREMVELEALVLVRDRLLGLAPINAFFERRVPQVAQKRQ